MRDYPTLTITWTRPLQSTDLDLALAALDGTAATAVEETHRGLRVFFTSAADRDAAASGLRTLPDVVLETSDVSDEDWAARSQAGLEPIKVAGIVVAPPWAVTPELRKGPQRLIVVLPSMGFGTGHHASTRLCLQALQEIELLNRSVLDVGTGSGVLAIAAAALGAQRAVGIDLDPDALANARDNAGLNGMTGRIDLHELTLESAATALGPAFDVIVANLTGGVLCRHADLFLALALPHARLIVSGFELHEIAEVKGAFARTGWRVSGEATEGTWVALSFTTPRPSTEL